MLESWRLEQLRRSAAMVQPGQSIPVDQATLTELIRGYMVDTLRKDPITFAPLPPGE